MSLRNDHQQLAYTEISFAFLKKAWDGNKTNLKTYKTDLTGIKALNENTQQDIAVCHNLVSFSLLKDAFLCPVHSRMGSSSSTEPLTASHGSLDRNHGVGGFRHRPSFFNQLSGQTFYNNEYGQLSEDGFCDFFASPDAPCLQASSNMWTLPMVQPKITGSLGKGSGWGTHAGFRNIDRKTIQLSVKIRLLIVVTWAGLISEI